MKALFISVLLLLLYSGSGEANRCFECNNVPSPISCGHVTTCEANESCFLEQVVTTSGNVVYNSGCETNSRCAALSGRRSITKRNSDIVTCRECCFGNHCNNRGCGVPEVDRTQRGVYCYNCPYLTDPTACESVSICTTNEKCLTYTREDFVGLLQDTVYSSECEHAPACDALQTLGKGQCCDQDFCNDHYNSTIVTKPLTVAPTNPPTNPPTNAPTVAPTEPPPEELTTVAHHASGHHCDLSGGYERHILRNNEELCVRVVEHDHEDWLHAKIACERDNARLVVTDTHEKIHLIENVLQSSSHQNYWIGLWDKDGNNKFYWLNNVLLSDSDWGTHPSQPTHVYQGKDEDCVYIYKRDHWHDTWCSHPSGYICERT